MKRRMFGIIGLILAVYLVVCGIVYLGQERLIFYPQKLSPDYSFRFKSRFQETFIQTQDGISLHGLLFKTSQPRGLIFYLHGNAGALDGWGEIAGIYTGLGYDIFMLDYRGFGKSEGRISNEKQFYDDAQAAYVQMKQYYPENQIIVVGYSIGTATAAKLASENHPAMLILQTPYYSLRDLARRIFPVLTALLPPALFAYPFETWRFVRATTVPIVIFHGTADEIIPYKEALRLKAHLKSADQFITLPGQRHNGVNENYLYVETLRRLLLPGSSH